MHSPQVHQRPAPVPVEGIDFTVAMRRAGPRAAVSVAAADLPAVATWVAKVGDRSCEGSLPDEETRLPADEQEAGLRFAPA
ncbi:hypothetical protein [Methylobacterium gnaphalii]|uniref:Uncharacterized protein n=1 Tax=Methylobacterium gnaphalii TaxID=1010610 RepID=A0A512JFY8_9HYPH|nr:hypothetical protein [Methylobacterium gnaphalii]GEP08867.1 hypothetical protein MGN01_07120 [Methylobacterium gnaphalii]GLS47632.1 hypothetical protein GCM10007885_04760 [Methylobacterium gnaphalii]